MKFCLAVYTADPVRARTALHFAEALLAQGHSLYRLFFFSEGVLNGLRPDSGPAQTRSLRQAWQTLIEAHGLDAIVCVSSAQKRGLDTGTAGCGDLPVAAGFSISGLGQLMDAVVQSDRLITFGD